MTITLEPDIAERINQKVASGEFASIGDVVNAALCYYLNHDLEDPFPIERMREADSRSEPLK